MYRKSIVYFLLLIVLVFSLIGCGNAKNASSSSPGIGKAKMSVAADQAAPEETKASAEFEGQNGSDAFTAPADSKSGSLPVANNPINSGHKVIQTGEISIETLKFEETISNITKYVTSSGGFIESSSVQGNRISSYESNPKRNARYTFRIPQNKYDQFFIDMKTFGTVVSEQSNGEDITDKYFDTEARLKSLRIQEERLLSLLQKADKMEDILAIEREVQNARYQIENYTGTIRKWDSLVNFSTVSVHIAEVEEIKPVSPSSKNNLFKRIAFGFTNSSRNLWNMTQDFIVFLISALPFIIPMTIIGIVAFNIWKGKKNKRTPAKKEHE